MSRTEQAKIHLLEGVGSFLECLAFPEALPDSELREALALHLEADSPLSPEHLLWGYYRGRGEHVWLFALPRGEARAAGYGDGDGAEVLPSVLPALVYFESTDATLPLLVRGVGRSVLFTSGADGTPEAMAFPPEREERFVRFSEDEDADRGESGGSSGLAIVSFESADFRDPRKLNLYFREGDPPEAAASEFKLQEKDVRTADIRPAEERSHWEASVRKMMRYRMVALSGLVALLLGGLVHLLLYIPLSGEENRRKNLEELGEEARQVEEAQELALSLRQLGRGGFQPFHILARINRIRPNSVYFTSVQVQNPNQVAITGLSTTVAEVNEFAKRLRSMDGFSGVTATVSSRAGEVSFELTTEYSGPNGDVLEPDEGPDQRSRESGETGP